jgi:CO dehydrogenase maturation factor
MTYTIAITGKGGVGKTTVAGLVVRGLMARKMRPVLAVDADPNTCLDAALGVRAAKTVGSVREDARQISSQGQVTGIAKQELLNLKIAESLVEGEDFDLIAMGRPEGPGCYCYANNVLRETIREIASNYPYVVIDNEAGLENLSRRIVQKVDLLVMTADPSKRGLETVRRLFDLAREMNVQYGKLAVVVNRVREENANGKLQLSNCKVEEVREYTKADFVVELPDNLELARFDEDGACLLGLPVGNEVVTRVSSFLDKVFGTVS